MCENLPNILPLCGYNKVDSQIKKLINIYNSNIEYIK